MTEQQLRDGKARELSMVVRKFQAGLDGSYISDPLRKGEECWRAAAVHTDLDIPVCDKCCRWWLSDKGRKYAAEHAPINAHMAWGIPVVDTYVDRDTPKDSAE